jgi:hypothetical protein
MVRLSQKTVFSQTFFYPRHRYPGLEAIRFFEEKLLLSILFFGTDENYRTTRAQNIMQNTGGNTTHASYSLFF